MSPKKVLIDLIKGVLQCFKGTPFNHGAYDDCSSSCTTCSASPAAKV